MGPTITRRTVLSSSCYLAGLLLSGCIGEPTDRTSNNQSTDNKNMSTDIDKETQTFVSTEIRIQIHPNPSLKEEQKKQVKEIRYGELSNGVQELVNTAISNQEFVDEKPWEERTTEFISIVSNNVSSQINDYQNSNSTSEYPEFLNGAYLFKEQNIFCITTIKEDSILSSC